MRCFWFCLGSCLRLTVRNTFSFNSFHLQTTQNVEIEVVYGGIRVTRGQRQHNHLTERIRLCCVMGNFRCGIEV